MSLKSNMDDEETTLDLEDTGCSYKEWLDSGFYVKKGSKSRFRDALGTPQFCVDQVVSYTDEGIRFLRDELSKIDEPW